MKYYKNAPTTPFVSPLTISKPITNLGRSLPIGNDLNGLFHIATTLSNSERVSGGGGTYAEIPVPLIVEMKSCVVMRLEASHTINIKKEHSHHHFRIIIPYLEEYVNSSLIKNFY